MHKNYNIYMLKVNKKDLNNIKILKNKLIHLLDERDKDENKKIIESKSMIRKTICDSTLDLTNDKLKMLKNLYDFGIPGINKLNSSGILN